MLKLNKKIEYSLMSLKIIASKPNGELTSARDICNKLNTPFDTISKVLQILNKNNVVSSIKGTNGGYYLQRKLDTISFSLLTHIIDEKIHSLNDDHSYCETSTSKCSLYDTCNIIQPIKNLNKKINNFLGNISIDEILNEAPSGQ